MTEYGLAGLANVNVELTSRCNKNCWMCGRRRVEREFPELVLKYGDMKFDLVRKIASELPAGIVVQLHNNGEALLYPRFGEAVKLFSRQITNVVTNGKLLVEKADEIIGHLDTLAVSIIEDDPESDEQYELLCNFLKLKGERKPLTLLRFNGNVNRDRYADLDLLAATRVLHSSLGSFNYKSAQPTIPEIGICQDILRHMAINQKGEASICVRFDPKRRGMIGDVTRQSVTEVWNSPTRVEWVRLHTEGKRAKVPLCSRCHYWGVPTGYPIAGRRDPVDENVLFDDQEGLRE